jgi:hypothetical protein
MIELNTKKEISAALTVYVCRHGSEVKAGNAIDVSHVTINKIVRGVWVNISDVMWLKIARGVGFDMPVHADTSTYLKLTEYFNKSQEQGVVFALTCKEGSGKTYAMDRYMVENPKNVLRYKCNKHTTAKELLQGLFKSVGHQFVRGHIGSMLTTLDGIVSNMEKPTIFIDEIEKTKNDILHLSIDLYNVLQGKGGINYLGTPYLKTRVDTGIDRGYMCFPEILSRFGGKIIELAPPTDEDAAMVARAKGIEDIETVQSIVHGCKNRFDEVDLRRVDRMALAQMLKRAA